MLRPIVRMLVLLLLKFLPRTRLLRLLPWRLLLLPRRGLLLPLRASPLCQVVPVRLVERQPLPLQGLPPLLRLLLRLLGDRLGLAPPLFCLEFVVARPVSPQVDGPQRPRVVRRNRLGLEVAVAQGPARREALLGVQLQRLLQEVERRRGLDPGPVLLPQLRPHHAVYGDLPRPDQLKIPEALPRSFRGGADQVEYEFQLVHVGLAREDGPSQNDFGEDAPR